MQKIISVFQRNYDTDHLIRDEVVPGAEWVLAGEGVATLKIDGTCCLVRRGVLYKRYDAKKGKQPPVNFEPAQEPDPITGHWPGWVPVGDEPDSRWHRLALGTASGLLEDGTYELIGPKVQGNPHNTDKHILIRHGYALPGVPRSFEGLRQYLIENAIEGIVFHHTDGRMAKVKRRDYGLQWPVRP